MTQMLAIDPHAGHPAMTTLSPGVVAVVATSEPNWDDRLWDIVFVSNAPGTQRIVDTLRWFTVHLDLGLPEARVEHFVREDVDGVPHLYLLKEWNAGHKPIIVIPQVSMIGSGAGAIFG
jgi:hypothetical protein